MLCPRSPHVRALQGVSPEYGGDHYHSGVHHGGSGAAPYGRQRVVVMI